MGLGELWENNVKSGSYWVRKCGHFPTIPAQGLQHLNMGREQMCP